MHQYEILPKQERFNDYIQNNCKKATIKYNLVDGVGYALYIHWIDKCYEERLYIAGQAMYVERNIVARWRNN
jgi:hypothetical protein